MSRCYIAKLSDMRMCHIAMLTVAICSLMACSENGMPDDSVDNWPWEEGGEEVTPPATEEPQEPEEPEIPVEPNQAYVDAGWTNVGDEYGVLPEGVNVYKSPAQLQGKAAIAYIAVADMSKVDWDVWSVKANDDYSTDDSYRTPSKVYEEYMAPVIINGGYFFYEGGNYTSSLAVSEYKYLAYNINYASEDWVTVYEPTRAAFIEKSDGSFDACWSFWTGVNNFFYQKPAENSYGSEPQKKPGLNFPDKGVKTTPATGIGGGPVLINDGKIANTWSEEMFDKGGVDPTYANPRTAIGATADNKLIFFVCEGRNMTQGVSGMTTENVANVLQALGCVEAINLDGGGSSCMLVNGKETIKVSDKTQRAVASAVMMK